MLTAKYKTSSEAKCLENVNDVFHVAIGSTAVEHAAYLNGVPCNFDYHNRIESSILKF